MSLRSYLDKLREEHLNFCLENMPARRYTIKTTVVSPQYGSILDEWLRLNTMTDIRKEDIDYLRRVCTPHMFIQEKATVSGTLSFDVDLGGEEFAMIHIYPSP